MLVLVRVETLILLHLVVLVHLMRLVELLLLERLLLVWLPGSHADIHVAVDLRARGTASHVARTEGGGVVASVATLVLEDVPTNTLSSVIPEGGLHRGKLLRARVSGLLRELSFVVKHVMLLLKGIVLRVAGFRVDLELFRGEFVNTTESDGQALHDELFGEDEVKVRAQFQQAFLVYHGVPDALEDLTFLGIGQFDLGGRLPDFQIDLLLLQVKHVLDATCHILCEVDFGVLLHGLLLQLLLLGLFFFEGVDTSLFL